MKSILILTKTKYVPRLIQLIPDASYGTVYNEHKWMNGKYDIIISYCYPRKIRGQLLDQNILNLHPAPLPEYKGGDPYKDGCNNEVLEWAVTLHKMTEEYDEGETVRSVSFKLERPPSKNELWYVSHTYAINLLVSYVQEKRDN